MTTSERKQMCEKIARLLYTHHNEKITLDDGTTLYYILYDSNLPLPKQLPPLAINEPAGLYVDEIFAYEENAREGFGVQIALSAPENPDDEDTEYVRIDTLDLEDADDELLGAILTAMTAKIKKKTI